MPLSGFGISIMLASRMSWEAFPTFQFFGIVYNWYDLFPECLGEFATEAFKPVVCFVQRSLLPHLINRYRAAPSHHSDSAPVPYLVTGGQVAGGEACVVEGDTEQTQM